MIVWDKTNKKVVELLSRSLLPWHYKQAYHMTVCQGPGNYSDKTDPIEKFRQHYAEHYRNDVALIPGGYLVLRRWFPEKSQLSMLPPEPMTLKGNCIVSYEAGYEFAKREPHMRDWFKDAHTVGRHERRRRANLVESHIKNYFATKYAKHYKPPSNHQKYEDPADEDFFLDLPRMRMAIDVKSWSYEREEGGNGGVARTPHDEIVYLWGDWQDDETVLMYGICSGKWLKTVGKQYGNLVHIGDNYIWPIECLLVMLNMVGAELNYVKFLKDLKQQELSKAA